MWVYILLLPPLLIIPLLIFFLNKDDIHIGKFITLHNFQVSLSKLEVEAIKIHIAASNNKAKSSMPIPNIVKRKAQRLVWWILSYINYNILVHNVHVEWKQVQVNAKAVNATWRKKGDYYIDEPTIYPHTCTAAR